MYSCGGSLGGAMFGSIPFRVVPTTIDPASKTHPRASKRPRVGAHFDKAHGLKGGKLIHGNGQVEMGVQVKKILP